jgi:hypothetical protein
METVTIAGREVTARTAEGLEAKAPLSAFLNLLSPKGMDTGDLILPDGVKSAISRPPCVILVHQTSPQPVGIKWIAPDSPADYGPQTSYRLVRIGVPYVVVLAVFAFEGNGNLVLTDRNECFFRVKPLRSLDDPLMYPGLLNCSKFTPQNGRPLSWICTQHLDRSVLAAMDDPAHRIRKSLHALLRCLWETGFNRSSERHEGTSWYEVSRKVDERIATVENWQAATEANGLVGLDIPWLPTHLTLRQVAARIFDNQHAPARRIETSRDLARLVFNAKRPDG